MALVAPSREYLGRVFLHMGPFIDFFKVAVYNEKRVDKEDAS